MHSQLEPIRKKPLEHLALFAKAWIALRHGGHVKAITVHRAGNSLNLKSSKLIIRTMGLRDQSPQRLVYGLETPIWLKKESRRTNS